jgi:S-adenosylmethionine hydrolase
LRDTQILLFTDFGWQGPYVGQMLAVLQRLAPGVPVTPVQSDAPRGDPRRSAFLLAPLVAQSATGAIWVCVVDPGVGGDRQPLVVEAEGRWLVGPDNGLLIRALRAAAQARAARIDWRPARLSSTFHGRDLFAPVAAQLARGQGVKSSPVAPAVLAGADWPEDLPEVVYIDGFGNAMTGLRAATVPTGARLSVAGQPIDYHRTFCEAPPMRPFWYCNSLGLVEIAVNQGRADAFPEITPGAAVDVLG